MKTTIHYYCFNCAKLDQKEQAEELKNLLGKVLGLKPFTSDERFIKKSDPSYFMENFSREIELDENNIFNNQWNGTWTGKSFRCFDWFNVEFTNKDYFVGHWIEPTYATMDARGKFQCRYCGKIHEKNIDGFCHSCFGSEYLKKEELYLTQIKRIWNTRDLQKITITTNIEEEYLAAQEKKQREIGEKSLKDKYKDIDKKIAACEIEAEGYQFLKNAGFYRFHDVFFYNHSLKFIFGHRNKMTVDEKIRMDTYLRDIGFADKFNYEIKTTD